MGTRRSADIGINGAGYDTAAAFRKSRFTTAVASFLLGTGFLFLPACGDKVKPGTAEVKRPAVSGVELAEVKPTVIDEYYETSGTVRPKTASTITSRVMGTVASMRVNEGDRVSAGQTLLTIDDRDLEQKILAAEAGHREALKALEAAQQHRSFADATYQRYKRLFDDKALTRQELDQIETQKRVADAEYERAQEMVNRTKAGLSEAQIYRGFANVTSPVSGIVAERKIDFGSMAVPGIPLFVVEDTSSLRIDVHIGERLSGKLSAGMPVDIVIDTLGMERKGRIREIVQSVDPASRTFLVKIETDGSGLKSGLYAKVRIPVGKREAFLLPRIAVVEKGQLTGLFTADDKGILTYRLVRLGKQHGSDIEILSGVKAGERVVVAGADRAVDGGVIPAVGAR